MLWTKKNVNPVSSKAIEEMKFIAENISNKTLQHNQADWHCGTAHCFGGWCEVIAAEANKRKKRFTKINLNKSFDYDFYREVLCPYLRFKIYTPKLNSGSYGKYAADRWGLTRLEANILFDGLNSIRNIKSIIKKLENGYRAI